MDILAALGFGPETLLLSEPKLFMNGRFLASLLVEIEDELESLGARRALFQIGLLFGLRDAYRITAMEMREPREWVAESTLLAIQIGHNAERQAGSGEIIGSWPETYEAGSRLSRLGPDDAPACALSAGYTSGWLSGSLDTDILVVENQCRSCGDETCSFTALEIDAWRERDDVVALELIPQLPYESFRDIARGFAQPLEAMSATPAFDFDASMVHVWGPVMVLPFSNIDEALHTVEMLGRDPDTSEVRTVVVDLRGEGLDEGFTAAALEQILETIEAWGAEAILTNVSPLAETVVADLEVKHLLLRKDLPEAIAAAFQIAEAQRHLI
ncbi:MAG: putative hydrocarbon binding protein [Myxococcota bacterium]|jgi:predicted hydrocarbon binding protein